MSEQVCIVTVTIKGNDRTLKTKNLIYAPIQASAEDPVIKHCVDSAVSSFNDDVEKIKVKIDLLIS